MTVKQSNNDNIKTASEPILEGIYFKFLVLTEIVLGIVALIFGGIVMASQLVEILRPQGLVPLGQFSALTIQGLVSFVLGLISVRVAVAILDKDMAAFSSCLFINAIHMVVFLTLPLPSSLILFAFAWIPILLLFQPGVRVFWFPSFKEDMEPRIRETHHSLSLVKKSPLVIVGIVIITFFIIVALAAPWITTYGPEERIWRDAHLPPMSPSTQPGAPIHYFGTDDTGGDVFSRLIWAAQLDLRISITVVLVAVILGTLAGAVAGYYGGAIDEILMRVTDVFFAIPGLILAMAIVVALGRRSMDNIMIALMITWWPVYARIVRGQVLAEREKLYVEAARSVGASDSRIILFHILPNTIQPLIVQSTMDTGSVLLTAAGLAFIGFGPPAGMAEWGYMVARGQEHFMSNIWAVFFPGLAILLVALAFNLVGDGIRDIFDPKLRRR